MGDPRVENLVALDRDLGRTVSSLSRWRSRLAQDPEAHADEDPFEATRQVAGKSTWEALKGLTPTAAEVPLRDALLPWVATLTMARLLRDDDVAFARTATQPVGRFQGEAPQRISWRDAWRGVVAARSAAEVRLCLDAGGDAGEPLAAVTRRRAEKRVEIARRFGYAHPWEILGTGQPDALRAAAHRLLGATEDLSHAVWKDTAGGVAQVLYQAVGREADEGWPARLTPRWLEGVFGKVLSGLRIDLPALPAALGAASFARALYSLGFAVRLATPPTAMPFTLSREPGDRVAHRQGFVFAALPTDPGWQARVLGLGQRAALRQARVLGRTALLDTRLHAARLLLGDDTALAPRDLFEELAGRVLGSPLDARLRGAWPSARDDESARFVARIQSRALAEALREGFDVDWFRNPRAWAHLRVLSGVPADPAPDASALLAEVDALARAFEGALG